MVVCSLPTSGRCLTAVAFGRRTGLWDLIGHRKVCTVSALDDII